MKSTPAVVTVLDVVDVETAAAVLVVVVHAAGVIVAVSVAVVHASVILTFVASVTVSVAPIAVVVVVDLPELPVLSDHPVDVLQSAFPLNRADAEDPFFGKQSV